MVIVACTIGLVGVVSISSWKKPRGHRHRMIELKEVADRACGSHAHRRHEERAVSPWLVPEAVVTNKDCMRRR